MWKMYKPISDLFSWVILFFASANGYSTVIGGLGPGGFGFRLDPRKRKGLEFLGAPDSNPRATNPKHQFTNCLIATMLHHQL